MWLGIGFVEAELVLRKAVLAKVGAEELERVFEPGTVEVDVVILCKFFSWWRHISSNFDFGLLGNGSDRDWSLRGGLVGWRW
jgi:hypothetical protein